MREREREREREKERKRERLIKLASPISYNPPSFNTN
jgi:hypothetical protein